MKLWLVRHGDAGDHTDDPEEERERGLTEDGQEVVEAIAREIAKQDVQPKIIFASSYARTLKTADAIGKVLGIEVNPSDELNPHMPMDGFLKQILDSDLTKRVMIVAHSDNIHPTMNALEGDMGECAREADDTEDGDWPPMVKAEVRYVGIDRDDGDWECRWRCTPGDLGFEDEE